MATLPVPLLAFNRGLVSPLALARLDLKRLALSAEVMTNWIPKSLGPMSLRPGWEYIATTNGSKKAKHIDFVFSTDDTALIQITNQTMRVLIDDEVLTRPTVSTTITGGTFSDPTLPGWTDADEAGATSSWLTGGYLSLVGTRFNAAVRTQQVSLAGSDTGVEHGLRLVVARGTVTLRVGTTLGADDLIPESDLGTGAHSLAFTPTTSFYIRLSNKTQYAALVDSCTIDPGGALSLPVPWEEIDLPFLRWHQSGDIEFIACDGFQQRKIERRGIGRSWSIVLYEAEDGPFRIQNVTSTTLTASGLTGDITLTASSNLFKPSHVGALYKLDSVGQNVTATVTGQGQWTNSIRVVGVDNARVFQLTLTNLGGTGTTATLQRSVGEEGSWVDVTTYTTDQASISFDDSLDNQIVFYRLGVDTGDYSTGTITASLSYSGGSITGVARVTGYSSPTSVSAAVLSPMGSTTATDQWAEGIWSDYRGWPTSVRFYEGRLWWFGKNWNIGSVSDSYYSFDTAVEGESAPIIRTIGFGPVDFINWAIDLQRLLVGAEGAELSIRSNSLDETLTNENYNLKDASTYGSAPVQAIKVDGDGIYIDRATTGLNNLSFDTGKLDYGSGELTILYPQIGSPGFVHLAVQRYPDTRVHAVRSDGTVVMLVFNKAEEVKALIEIETDGEVEDVTVLPGSVEDAVYYTVKRTINGSDVRYLEKWALESECLGGTLNKQADSFFVYSGSPTTSISVPHLAGEEVVVWADGVDIGTDEDRQQTYTVSSAGLLALTESVANAVIGLHYQGQYKNAKFAFAPLEAALMEMQRVKALRLMLANTHAQGLRYGEDFDNLDELPLTEEEADVDPDSIWTSYDYMEFEFAGDTSVNPRMCLQADAPRPCTVLGAVPVIDT